MKKKIWIPILSVLVLIAVLFVPIPMGSYDDGGTREYVSLTYKIVAWNRLTNDGVYERTAIYFGEDRGLSIDELWAKESEHRIHRFRAEVLQVYDTDSFSSVLVAPLESESEFLGSDKISFGTTDLPDIGAEVGSIVEVTYNGLMMESYPAQIKATDWCLSSAKRDFDYVGEWVSKETAEHEDKPTTEDITITEIYENCFFGRFFLHPNYQYIIKLNGRLGEEWCVGDRVSCTYENSDYDAAMCRKEADVIAVKASDWDPDNPTAAKPVIYLYPEQETEVTVRLHLDGELTCTYPTYGDGWTVTASPDGVLTDDGGQTYQYLYWEGISFEDWDLSRGFCVRGGETAAFLEWALASLGLTRREANEFIVYWLPLMEKNSYNVIAFQTDRYTNAAELEITPAPDTLIRVFMAWQSVDTFVQIEPQTLSAPAREGFTVVEWGGSELRASS